MLRIGATRTIFTSQLYSEHNKKGREDMKVNFGERLKKEREKRGWSQTFLAEKIHVSRQSVSKWETGKNYPSIEVIIDLSDLFEITIDELLRSDEALTEKVIQDSKQLAYPKWKDFFDAVFLLGLLLLIIKFVVYGINRFFGTSYLVIESTFFEMIVAFAPVVLMIIGGVISGILKEKYIEE